MIRISGDRAIDIANIISSKDLVQAKSNQALHGWVIDGGQPFDEVMFTVFRGPRSFTGQDTVEIACHGSQFIQQRIIELLLQHGAQAAGAGEFTMRAYLHGRMDLSQAEAIGDLIASENAAMHAQALHQMRGGFSREIESLRERLIHFASMVELELDFAEEDVEFANKGQLIALVREIAEVIVHLRDSFRLGNAIKSGVPVAIVGAPNMGKSTLLNALLNDDRAIVSDIPGTTRDTVEDFVVLEGIKFRFIDTAGIRATDDAIEMMGIERSLGKAREAEIILLLFDALLSDRKEVEDMLNSLRNHAQQNAKIFLIANKIDQAGVEDEAVKLRFDFGFPVLPVSAKMGKGIDSLKNYIVAQTGIRSVVQGETIVTNARHYESLRRAAQALYEVEEGIRQGVSGDFLATDIRRVLYNLGEITGNINADDLLNSIFSKFCIGK